MSAPPNRNGVWARILVVAIPLAIAGLIGWGTLREKVDNTARAMDGKANRETVEVQFNAIMRELQGAREDIADLKRGRP